jgi:hypothetical protein
MPLGLCTSLTFMDVSLNDTLSLIFCREVDLEQKTIKRVTIQPEETTIKWMLYNCPANVLKEFQSEAEGKTIDGVTL